MNNKPRIPFEFKILRLRECPFPMVELATVEQVADYWRAHIPRADWYDESKEALIVLVLNARHRIMGHNLVSLGGLDSTTVAAREVFRPVICMAGAACILVHNHPSGDPAPSEADIRTTRDLIRAGQLLRIAVLDHVIIGRSQTSLRQLGYFYE